MHEIDLNINRRQVKSGEQRAVDGTLRKISIIS